MKRWIRWHLFGKMLVATASTTPAATPEATCQEGPGEDDRDDPRSSVPRSPRHAGRPTERTDARVAPHRDLLLESGVVALNDNPLDRLRRSGLI